MPFLNIVVTSQYSQRRQFGYVANSALLMILALVVVLINGLVQAQAQPVKGSTPAQKIPRFVSLRSDKVEVRQGPSREHPVVWTFTRAGLPVEVTAEFDNWRRIRDADGSEGWVLQGRLSKRRTGLVAPWENGKSKTFDLFARVGGTGEVKAKIESGVLVALKSCDGTWCRILVNDVEGYLKQEVLWGAYAKDDKFNE